MKLAVLSGKGGAGKTFVAVNLAAVAQNAVYVDCDVEEPNGRLFLKPEHTQTETVYKMLPAFDAARCTGCRRCVDFCRFNALVYLKKGIKVFSDVCHSCGGCAIVCPEHAVTEQRTRVGVVEEGFSGGVRVITGVLDHGQASGVPVIKGALSHAEKAAETLTVIDCPPGSACPVVESVADADYCILVAEPTAFGFHNFKMVYELVSLLKRPCGVVINKEDQPYEPLETFCAQQGVRVLAHIPYNEKTAALCAQGGILSEKDETAAELFRALLAETGGAAQ